jgi:hypothetical protein
VHVAEHVLPVVGGWRCLLRWPRQWRPAPRRPRVPASQVHLQIHGPIAAADVAEVLARQDAGRVYGTLDEHPAIEE